MPWSWIDVYLVCATLGGAVLVLQLVLLFFGGHADGDGFDVDHHDASDGLSFISIRTIAAFLTFFGLTGWWGSEAGWGPVMTMVVSVGSGGVMMGLVAWLFGLLHKLQSSGNIDPANAIGQSARVYLRIPGHHAGKGKITVTVQGRAKEYEAVTAGADIPTGSAVRVVAMSTPNTFEVALLE